MQGLRQERANAEIIKALSIILREKINDPRISGEFITLTYANVSADFRHCKVGFSSLTGNKQKIQKLLTSCEGYIKRELLNMVKLPYAPELEFIVDVGEENSEKVNKILSQLDIPEEESVNSDDEI